MSPDSADIIGSTEIDDDVDRARAVAGAVVDPELPMLSLADLGVLRRVGRDASGAVLIEITPTYSGCPAMATIRADLLLALRRAGIEPVVLRTVLQPPWTSAMISERGRAALRDHGIAPPAPPAPAGRAQAGSGGAALDPVPLVPVPRIPVPLVLGPTVTDPVVATVPCPRCGSTRTRLLSRFGSTACKAIRRCAACQETFDQIKDSG